MGRGTLASVARSFRLASCRSRVFRGGLAHRRGERFPFPVPADAGLSGKGNGSCADELVAAWCSLDASLAGEFVEDAAEPGGTDATGLAQLCKAEWALRLCERGLDPVGQRHDCGQGYGGLGWSRQVVDAEGEALVCSQGHGEVGDCGGGAVLDGEHEPIASTAQVEVRVAPGVELGAAAQGLAGAGRVRALAGMMDDSDRHLEMALELAQVGEQRCHVGALVFAASVQSDEGVEDEEAGP